MRSGVVSSLSSVLPTSQVFTSGYVNTETILHFFFKITNERGTKTVFTYAHVKWFYGQSECAYYLNYFIMVVSEISQSSSLLQLLYLILFELSLESILIFWKDLITAWTGWIGILPIIHFRNNFLDEWLSIFYGNNWVLCCDVLSSKWKVINLRLVFWIKYNV